MWVASDWPLRDQANRAIARIESLSISGVRSFGPASREVIKFNTPLTLIVGYNGSGKTTIIECLKYATTGELPPNSKGGAFIHDPKLCGEKEVMAQVKLAFRALVGDRYVLNRNLLLTVKKTTRSQKTLEGSLVHYHNGERTNLSTKVAKLDELVPEQLGVSTAVLDAVIFCHQDESLWPMSEPAALKKRFDEIFEALRYTKAIDNLKVIRKKQGEELAKLKIQEEQERQTKEKADRAEKRSVALQADIEDLRTKCEELTVQMDELQDKINKKRQQAESFLGIVHELKNKQEKLADREESIVDLKNSIKELPESDEWLENTLAQFEEKMSRYQLEVEQNTAQYNDLQREMASTRKALGQKQAEQGKHESDQEKYERQLQARVETVRAAASLHSIRGYDGDLDDSLVRSFNDKIQKLFGDKKRELEHTQRDNNKELDAATGAITTLESRKSARTQDRTFAKSRIGAIDKKVQQLQGEVGKLDVDEGAKAVLDSQYRDLDERLQKASRDFEAAGWDGQLHEENDRLFQLETENDKLGRELVECTRQASERAQLDLRKKELKERNRKLDTLVSTWKDKLAVMLGDDWTPQTAEAKFQAVLGQHAKAVEVARRERDATQKELHQIDFKLSSLRDRLAKLVNEGNRSRDVVNKKLAELGRDVTIESYLEDLEELEEVSAEHGKDVALFKALTEFYQGCMGTLQKNNKCRLCERDFANQAQSKQKLMDKIKKQLSLKDQEESQASLDKAQETIGHLRGLRDVYDVWVGANNRAPPLQAEVKAAEAQRLPVLKRLEAHDVAVNEAEEKRVDVESMSKTVATLSQSQREIRESESQIERLASQTQSGGATRTAEELHELQAANGEQMRAVKSRVSKLTTEKQRMRDTVSSLELERSELNNRRNNVARQLERKKDLLSQVQSLKEDNAVQRDVIDKADKDLEALEPEIAKARAMREDSRQKGQAKEHRIAEERDRLARSVSELKMIEADIREYLDRGGPDNIVSGQRAIQALEQTIARVEKEVTDLTVQTNKLKQEIHNSDSGKQNISSNLKYRRDLRLLAALRQDIAELESRNATEDYERLVREARGHESQYARQLAERSSVMGGMKSKDEELGRLLEEWEQEYRDAGARYRGSHIKVETTKAAIEDLGRYGSALDKAIMQYHSLKMEEVNRIAGELWQATYQGTDIDTILIRSDSETATGRRNYNYRVCMVKQDTEMDMRGRCSAGQKVLASIIIRLALAESFGVNCGIIALDEPTTNLDRDNIKSLAVSLHAIIKARQAQANFQLIVITHDEEFLRHMKCGEFCESFYRVRRDDKQNSVIKRESIATVMG